MTVVTKAKANTNAVSPKKGLNALIGLAVGLLVGMALAIIKEITDTTVKDTDFITKDLGLTSLGAVYHIHSNEDDFGLVKVIDKNAQNVAPEKRRRV